MRDQADECAMATASSENAYEQETKRDGTECSLANARFARFLAKKN